MERLRVPRHTRPETDPRAWIMAAVEEINADPAATGRRLLILADRLARVRADDLAVDDQIEMADRLAAIENHVRQYRALEAAILAGRPAIEAAESLLRRRPPGLKPP